jgi:hypothetical protein
LDEHFAADEPLLRGMLRIREAMMYMRIGERSRIERTIRVLENDLRLSKRQRR